MSVQSLSALQPLALAAVVLMQVLPHYMFVHPYIQMVVSASCTVYVGCLRSVFQQNTEAMSAKDAYMFPIIGSGVLFTLYILIKKLSKEYLNMLLGTYFFAIGTLVVHGTLLPYAKVVLPASMHKHKPLEIKFQIPFLSKENGLVDLKLTLCDGVCISAGVVLGALYLSTKNWVLNNVFGVMFSVQGIEHISLGNVKIGAALLCGLFFYDIFWVFGTDVMVTVAKGFEAPIKLVFPKTFPLDSLEKPEFSMVGLGDIVIPGIFVALLLRFDHSRNPNRTPYFLSCFSGYVAGLLATIFVMHVFQAAQPALLYLVPACLLTCFVPAFMRNEVPALLAYSEEEDEKKDGSDKKTDGEKKTDGDKKDGGEKKRSSKKKD